MALVVFLRGLNVGGHRSFRPTTLARQLRWFDAVNIGAAGTLVVRKQVRRAQLRAAIVRRLPFDAEIVICDAKAIARLVARDPFAGLSTRSDVVRFVSVLSRRPRLAPSLPVTMPPRGKWLLKVLERDGTFVLGLYRRHMKVIGYLGTLDRLFRASATTRNWNTIVAIAKVLDGASA